MPSLENTIRVASYVTAYSDQEALNKCLSALLEQSVQPEIVLVLDNSPSPIQLPEESLNLLTRHCPENRGIAFGLAWALDWSCKNGFDFLWIFDQDSAPDPNCLEKLLQTYSACTEQDEKIGIVACTPIDPRSNLIITPSKFFKDQFVGMSVEGFARPYECDAPITSGSLLNLHQVIQVSAPDARLFIDGIDLDYGLRLRKVGLKNIVVPDAIMEHNFGSPVKLMLFGQHKIVHLYSALRYFYICRNHTYLELKYSQGLYKLTCAAKRIKFLFLQIFWILLLHSDDKPKKIFACFRGTFYGFLGALDKGF